MYRSSVLSQAVPQPAVGSAPQEAQPWDAFLICMAAFLLVAIARLHDVIPGMSTIRPGLLLALLSVILYLGNTVPARRIGLLKHPISMLALFIYGWAILGAPLGLWPGQSVRFVTGDGLRVAIFFTLLAACVRNLQDVKRLLMTLAVGGMLFSLFAAVPAGYRMVTAGGYDANDSAMFVALTIPLVLYFLVKERRLALKVVFAFALVLCVVAIVRTGSRGGFLAMAAVIAYAVLFMRQIKPVFRLATVGVVALVMTFAASTEYWAQIESINDPTDYNYTDPSGRKAVWERARGYIKQNPVLGVGIMNFPIAEEQHPMIAASISEGRGFKYSAAHSMWYQVGSELGIPALIAFVALFAICILYLRRLIKLARGSPQSPMMQEAGGLASALIGSLVALIVAGTFLSNAYWGMVWGPIALILGLFKVLRLQGIDVTRRGPQALPGTGTQRPQPVVTSGRSRKVAFAPTSRLHRPARVG